MKWDDFMPLQRCFNPRPGGCSEYKVPFFGGAGRDGHHVPVTLGRFGPLLVSPLPLLASSSSGTNNAEYNKSALQGAALRLRPDKLSAPQPGQRAWVPGVCDLEHPPLVLPWHQ